MSFEGALALRYIASVMNAGASLDEALRALRDESPEPLRSQAAARLSPNGSETVQQRAQCLFAEAEYRLARAGLLLVSEAGGSVGGLLERCARQIEDRQRWMQRRRALSAQTVLSAWIVGLMPLVLVAMLAMIAPDYLEPLWTSSIGHASICVAVTLMAAGLLMVRRMVQADD